MKRRKSSTKPRILTPLTPTRCSRCGKLVRWRVLAVYRCADGKHAVRYLACSTTGCDGREKQIADVAQ